MNLEASALETLGKRLNVLSQFDYFIDEPKKHNIVECNSKKTALFSYINFRKEIWLTSSRSEVEDRFDKENYNLDILLPKGSSNDSIKIGAKNIHQFERIEKLHTVIRLCF